MHRLIFALAVALSFPRVVPSQASAVRRADLSRLSVNDFRDDELDLPYYLANFHRVANSVALSGPRRGFIDIAVWRDLKDNQPYNARIMESAVVTPTEEMVSNRRVVAVSIPGQGSLHYDVSAAMSHTP